MTTTTDTATYSTFYVFIPTDDTLTTFTYMGQQQARDRDHAIKLQFGKTPPRCVAVSAHAWRVREPEYAPRVIGLQDVPMPINTTHPEQHTEETLLG